MSQHDQHQERGLAALSFTIGEQQHPLFKKIVAALREEREKLRDALEHPGDIATTTLQRGEIRLVKRILARTEEVGPESRQSEGDAPESATPALVSERFPVIFEK